MVLVQYLNSIGKKIFKFTQMSIRLRKLKERNSIGQDSFSFNLRMKLDMNMKLNINVKRHRRRAHNSSILFPDLSQKQMNRTSKKYKTLVTNRQNLETEQLKLREPLCKDQIFLERFKMNRQGIKEKMKLPKKKKAVNPKSKITSMRTSLNDTTTVNKTIALHETQAGQIAKQILIATSFLKKSALLEVQKINQIMDSMNQSFHNYQQIQASIKLLNVIVQDIKSSFLSIKFFMLAALIMNQYYSYSLSLFYFQKAMKFLTQRQPYKYKQEINMELRILKEIARLLLNKGFREDARQCAYIYLRKLWKYKRIQEELLAYDFLGEIQNQLGNHPLGKYFHAKMCNGDNQASHIVKLSNMSLQKKDKDRRQTSSFDNINQIIDAERNFNQFLREHYQSQVQTLDSELIFNSFAFRKRIPKIVLTHKSPNRITRNYHQLQRTLMRERPSKELHFIANSQLHRLISILSEHSTFLNVIKIHLSAMQTKNRHSLPLNF